MKKHLNVYSMAQIALSVALICVCSYLVVPLPFTPIVLSMHTVAINLVGLTLKPRHAAYTILIYLLMGAIGLPVFSGGSSGLAKLFGPTGGFYFGFLLAVIAMSLLRGKKNSFWRFTAVSIGCGIPIEHLLAVAFYCIYNGANIKTAFMTVSVPFIPGDIIKCFLSALIAVALNKALSKAKFASNM